MPFNGFACKMEGCPHRTNKHPPGIMFYSFPKDPDSCTLWAKACGKGSALDRYSASKLNKSHKVCSAHFTPDMLYGQRKTLKAGVLPIPMSELDINIGEKTASVNFTKGSNKEEKQSCLEMGNTSAIHIEPSKSTVTPSVAGTSSIKMRKGAMNNSEANLVRLLISSSSTTMKKERVASESPTMTANNLPDHDYNIKAEPNESFVLKDPSPFLKESQALSNISLSSISTIKIKGEGGKIKKPRVRKPLTEKQKERKRRYMQMKRKLDKFEKGGILSALPPRDQLTKEQMKELIDYMGKKEVLRLCIEDVMPERTTAFVCEQYDLFSKRKSPQKNFASAESDKPAVNRPRYSDNLKSLASNWYLAGTKAYREINKFFVVPHERAVRRTFENSHLPPR